MMPIAVDVALALAALPVLLAAGYLLLLTLASARRPPPAAAPPRLRFDLVVPAHDEEAGIAATVASLLALDWPAPLRRVVVVADNCRDATAARARAAGAEVLERHDPERRGKGYALALAFERSLAGRRADAVVVVDADTAASPGLLRAFAARLEAGALAVQARYGVRNPRASWRTGLMAIALALFHDVRSLGRERLGLSAGLRGNGMCFAARALREVPHRAFSIVEDLEYGIALGLAGHRVWYAGEAEVLGDMAAGEAASRPQRRRWEGGRQALRRAQALPLLRRALAGRDRVLLDLFADLVVPPLGLVAAAALAGLAATTAASLALHRPLVALWPWAGASTALAVHVLRGWWLSGTGLRGLGLLARAPAYLAWKLALALGRRAGTPEEWVRTPREPRA
ncbi:MAG TPA: glycosyltransferase family 2 protein [Anaeromyxobacteraceae bacterium]|nr:glycosyltransferase family 2 protein [Anaeromyxobacteraceae bacterium]